MLLHVSSLGARPLAGSATSLAISEATPVVLSLQLLDDERLEHASLAIRRSPAGDTGAPHLVLDTSANGSTAGVTWVTAAWGQARQVEAITLAFTSKPNPLLVRVHVARGDSAWFLPSGPHTFTMQAAMQLQVALPDVVADRVMVEFLDPAGVSVPVSLSATAPLTVVRGGEPRELSMAVQGRRPLLRWGGAIPTGAGLLVGDLPNRLRAELRGEVVAPGVSLELRAAVAGVVQLEWSFASVRIAQRFVGGQGMRTLPIPWTGSIDEPLLPSETGPVHVEALALSVAAEPVAEQLVLAPPEPPTTRHGQLVQPSHDAAQAIALSSPCHITGIDALVRAPAGIEAITLRLHADDRGRPAPSATLELQRELAEPTFEPTWIAFDCAKPFQVAAGVWWLVLRVDHGELVWLTVASGGAAPLLHRRPPGLWVPRSESASAGSRAVVRVRAASEPPAQPLSLSLRGVAVGGSGAWEIPLTIDDDSTVRWAAGPVGAPPPSTAVSLRAAVSVACTAVLSNLQLRYRPSNP